MNDFIARLIENKDNWKKMSLALACSIDYHQINILDLPMHVYELEEGGLN